MSDLAKIDVRATGTIRENRTGTIRNQKMISSKQLKKQERGCSKYCCDGTVYISKWHDNSVVTIASNWESHIPVHKVRGRVKGDVKEKPHLINDYNKGMGASISRIVCWKLTAQQYVLKMVLATFCQSSQYYGCRCIEDLLSDWRYENNPHRFWKASDAIPIKSLTTP